MENLYQFNHKFTEKKINPGQISLTIKHYLALKQIVEKKHKIAVIMEDNVSFTSEHQNTSERIFKRGKRFKLGYYI